MSLGVVPMVGDWSLSGRNIDRVRLLWQDFLQKKFPCSTEGCLCDLYEELIAWDGEVYECMRLLLQGRRVNLAKLRDERTIREMLEDRKARIASEELHAMEEYYRSLLLLLDDSLQLAERH
jgi:hypothetical protein